MAQSPKHTLEKGFITTWQIEVHLLPAFGVFELNLGNVSEVMPPYTVNFGGAFLNNRPESLVMKFRDPAPGQLVNIRSVHITSIVKLQLGGLGSLIKAAGNGYPDRLSRAHLADLNDRIKTYLDNKKS